jgi:predicted nucleic acid-binding Zn ribbon protein
VGRREEPRRIASALRSVRAEAEPATPLAAVQGAWPAAVGEGIAAQAAPVAERDGVVTVACASASWAQELDLLQEELLAGLAKALGARAPERLRFVVGEPPR